MMVSRLLKGTELRSVGGSLKESGGSRVVVGSDWELMLGKSVAAGAGNARPLRISRQHRMI